MWLCRMVPAEVAATIRRCPVLGDAPIAPGICRLWLRLDRAVQLRKTLLMATATANAETTIDTADGGIGTTRLR